MDDYHTGFLDGWKARQIYIDDWRKVTSSQTSGGAALMLAGLLVMFSIIGIVIAMPGNVVYANLILMFLGSNAIMIAGYFINRSETKSHQKRMTAFREKWGE